MKTFTFRAIAFDETSHWDGLPEGCTQVFGIYYFMEGEASYLCSLFPSSWCEFLENVFVGLDSDHPFVEENAYEGSDNYFDFIRVDRLPPHRLSRPVTFETEDREDAWEEACEYFRGHSPYIPLL